VQCTVRRQGLSSHAASHARRYSPRTVRRLPGRAGCSEALRCRDLLRPAAIHRFVAVEGVPWYLRSGKYLPDTATEVLVELKPAPQRLFRRLRAADRPIELTCASGSPPTQPLPLPHASSARAKTSSESSKSSICRKSGQATKRPTSGFSATPWPAMARFSRVKTRLRPRGSWSIRSSRTIIAFTFTNAAAGGRCRLTRLSFQTAVGITPAAQTHRDEEPDPVVFSPTRS